MKFRTRCVLIMICAAISSCTSESNALTAQEEQEIKIEIGRQVEGLRQAWDSLDPTAVVSFFSERSIDTYDSERFSYSELKDWAATGPTGIVDTTIGPFEDFRIDVLSADAVVTSWHNTVSETSTVGADPVRYRAFMTQVWVREGSDWRLLHNHESTLELGSPD